MNSGRVEWPPLASPAQGCPLPGILPTTSSLGLLLLRVSLPQVGKALFFPPFLPLSLSYFPKLNFLSTSVHLHLYLCLSLSMSMSLSLCLSFSIAQQGWGLHLCPFASLSLPPLFLCLSPSRGGGPCLFTPVCGSPPPLKKRSTEGYRYLGKRCPHLHPWVPLAFSVPLPFLYLEKWKLESRV